MNSQFNQAPKRNRTDANEAPMTGDDLRAKTPGQLDELLEQGEIPRKERSR